MATQQIIQEYIGQGSLPTFLQELSEQLKGVRDENAKTTAQVQSDYRKTADSAKQFSSGINAASQLVVALAKSANQGLPALITNLSAVADAAESVTGSLTGAERANFTQVNNALRAIAQQEGLIVREIDKEKAARIQTLVEAKKITAEEAKLLREVQAVVDTLKEANALPPNEVLSPDATERVKSVTIQLREAKAEAAALAAAGKQDTEEFERASNEAARLQKILADTGQTIKALNPGDKVQAFTQLGTAIAGGAQAIGGFAIALGGQNRELQESLFKFQSALFAVQGAQTFLKDFGDSFKDVLRVLGLSTAAQVESTAASAADIPIKTAQAGATAGVATASTAASTGIRGLTASLLASPLLPVVLLLTAMGAALAYILGQTKQETVAYQQLVDTVNQGFDQRGTDIALGNARKLREQEEDRARRLAEVSVGKRRDAEMTAKEQEEQRIANKRIDDETIQNIRRQKQERLNAFIELNNAFNKVVDPFGEFQSDRSDVETERLLNMLELEADATAKQITEAFNQASQARQKDAKEAEAQIANIGASALSEANSRREQELQEQKAMAEATKALREQLAADIERIEKELTDKILALELEGADPGERLEIERKASEEFLRLKERELLRLVALEKLRVKIGTEALNALSQVEKDAQADELIKNENIQLSLAQQEQFNTLRFLNEVDYFDKVAKLQDDNAEVLLSLQKEGADKQRAQLELDLVERADVLRKAGATDAQILAETTQARANLERSIARTALDIEEQTQIDLIEARAAGGVRNEKTERAAQAAILAVKIEFAEKALLLIDDTTSAEGRAQVAAIQKNIAVLKSQLGDLTKSIIPFRLSDLFDLSGSDAELFNQSVSQIGQAIRDIVSSNIDAQQRQLDFQLSVTDQLIEDNERRRDDLESQLEKERELQRQGLANNVDGITKAIEETKRVEAAALAEKKRIQAEQQKLARQQVLIDSAQQASSLASGVANLIKTWSSLPFGLGLVAAFAQAALIYSFFAGIKNKLAAASLPQGLWTGTKSVKREGYPSGVDTIPAMLTEDEAVVPVKSNRKHRGLVGAIIDDDFSKLTAKELEPILAKIDLSSLLQGTGILPSDKETSEVIRMNEQRIDRQGVGPNMAGVERRLDVLAAKVEAFRKQDAERPEAVTLPDGTVMLDNKKGHKTFIRP